MWRCVVYRFVFSSAFTVTSDGGPSGGAKKLYCAADERGPWALIEGQKGQKEDTEDLPLKRERR